MVSQASPDQGLSQTQRPLAQTPFKEQFRAEAQTVASNGKLLSGAPTAANTSKPSMLVLE
jgi:hypothetical protein